MPRWPAALRYTLLGALAAPGALFGLLMLMAALKFTLAPRGLWPFCWSDWVDGTTSHHRYDVSVSLRVCPGLIGTRTSAPERTRVMLRSRTPSLRPLNLWLISAGEVVFEAKGRPPPDHLWLPVAVAWVGTNELEITYPRHATVTHQLTSFADVTIRYRIQD